MHVRRQIREAFATRVTGLTTTGARVFQSRVFNLDAADLPALKIYTEVEDIQDQEGISYPSQPDLQHRTILLRCEAVAKANADMDDTLDLMCSEVETAVSVDPALGGLAKIKCNLISTDIGLDGSTDKVVGRAVMSWRVVVLTMSNAPDVAL